MSEELEKPKKKNSRHKHFISINKMADIPLEYHQVINLYASKQMNLREALRFVFGKHIDEKELRNREHLICSNKYIQQALKEFKQNVSLEIKKEIYEDRNKIIEDILRIKEAAFADSNYNAALKAYELIIKMQGMYDVKPKETNTKIEISFGNWSPTQGLNQPTNIKELKPEEFQIIENKIQDIIGKEVINNAINNASEDNEDLPFDDDDATEEK